MKAPQRLNQFNGMPYSRWDKNIQYPFNFVTGGQIFQKPAFPV